MAGDDNRTRDVNPVDTQYRFFKRSYFDYDYDCFFLTIMIF